MWKRGELFSVGGAVAEQSEAVNLEEGEAGQRFLHTFNIPTQALPFPEPDGSCSLRTSSSAPQRFAPFNPRIKLSLDVSLMEAFHLPSQLEARHTLFLNVHIFYTKNDAQ